MDATEWSITDEADLWDHDATLFARDRTGTLSLWGYSDAELLFQPVDVQ